MIYRVVPIAKRDFVRDVRHVIQTSYKTDDRNLLVSQLVYLSERVICCPYTYNDSVYALG